MMWRPSTAKHRAWSSLRKAGPARQAKPPRGPSPSGAWRSLAEASESIASLVAVVLIHGPTSSGGVRHYRTMTDRKSTRLNSSHSQISYAVFCLKKKKRLKPHSHHRTLIDPVPCHE